MPFVAFRSTGSSTACRARRALALLVLGTVLSLPVVDRAQAQDARPEGATTVVTEVTAPQSLADRALISAQELAMQAIGMIGIRYTFGGRNPDTGFDCSGLVRYVFDRVTGRSLPHNSFEMARMGTSVSQDELQPGDLVFFNTRGQRFSHVGIYVGEGRFIHAPSRGGRVHIVNMGDRYWVSRFNGARRLAV
jgi:cell wall-associated NlpC family hydrolase